MARQKFCSLRVTLGEKIQSEVGLKRQTVAQGLLCNDAESVDTGLVDGCIARLTCQLLQFMSHHKLAING